jgi:sugar lactone lactonase YvrE
LPRGVAIDDEGRLYVVDTSAHAVQVYKVLAEADRSPVYVGRFGAEGTLDGAFEFPNGVAVDTRGRVYVTDLANNRVQVWTY